MKSFVDLSDKEEAVVQSYFYSKKVAKKEMLLTEGEMCNSIWFIQEGYCRLFYTVDGNENTFQFFFPNSWYTDYTSLLSGVPTLENLQALTECHVLVIDKKNLNELYSVSPVFEKLGRLMAEKAFLSISNLNKMRTNETPQERYLNLIKQRPEIVENIPQHYVASYLGVQPESLSRIRKRIFKAD
jgi:CRP-like cAMP-binding protein